MLLHFVFMVSEGELESRSAEYAYVEKMSVFFKSWIGDSFGLDYDVRCDPMVARREGLLSRPGLGSLLRDHRERGESTWHFYLANFRPFWTDSLSEGYHSENMCMIMWSKPRPDSGEIFLAEKNCVPTSYELAHELLRQRGVKDSIGKVNDVWARHFSGAQEFVAYGADHRPTVSVPEFLTIDPTDLNTI